MRRLSDGRPAWTRLLLVGVLAAIAALIVAGCGGDDDDDGGDGGGDGGAAPTGEAITLGILSDCEGAFGAFYEPDIAGAQVPLIERGATAVNPDKPSAGIEGAEIAGRPIEIVGYGCADDTAEAAIRETRRLMEQEDADILIGPLSGDEGIAVANYAKEHQDKTFINGTSGAQDTTLKVQAPNFFRFHTDGAQWSAGVGDYAYNELGWRTAATIGDDYSFPYTSVGGFIADFCAVGGEVTERIWPPLGETDYSSFIAQIPDDVDGLYVGIGGSGLIKFINQYEQQVGPVDPEKMIGNLFVDDPLVLEEVGDSFVGVITSGETAGDSTEPEAVEYVNQIESAYPEIGPLASSVFVYNYYTAMEGLIAGLEAVDGDISDLQAFWDALSNVELDAAYGHIRLDENRQAISDNYVKQVVAGKGGQPPTVETILRIPEVDQSFGGIFTENTPPPDRENPQCEEADLPWAGKAEPVNFGGGGGGGN
jgi:branched-chain amino acid transport system substrate-binding protein